MEELIEKDIKTTTTKKLLQIHLDIEESKEWACQGEVWKLVKKKKNTKQNLHITYRDENTTSEEEKYTECK